MKIITDLGVENKRVFVRADLDVPLRNAQVTSDKSQVISDESTRLRNLKPTVDYLVEHGVAQIIIAGHIDRPQKPDPALSTKQLLPTLEKILGRKIEFSEQLTIDNLQLTDQSTVNGQMSDVVLLENLRFWPGEVANDLEFAKKLAALADIYVNEAFGNCHRVHASMVALPSLLPYAAGFHLEKEISELSKLLNNPLRPFVAIVGGVKIDTKVPVIANLAKIADFVLIGGELPIEIVKNNASFPDNVIIASHTQNKKDIDNDSVSRFVEIILKAKTVIWNGPMGVFEEGFDKGTGAVAGAIIESDAYSVVGGGETTQFLANSGILSKFSFVSAGGGAMLEFLAGKTLPALETLG